MADLRTDYKDDLLDTSVNTQRKYRMVTNDDGTVSFVDETVYTQNGDTFGASEVNQIHAAVNLVNESLNLDFSNTSEDVQDLKTFLQKALDKLFPKVFNVLKDGVLYGIDLHTVLVESHSYVTLVDGLWKFGHTSNESCHLAACTDAVDVTNFSKIKVTIKSTYGGYFGLYSVPPTSFITTPDVVLEIITNGTYEIDISSVSGTYYIGFKNLPTGSSASGYISEIVLE